MNGKPFIELAYTNGDFYQEYDPKAAHRPVHLTPRERQVIITILTGHVTTRDIAVALSMSSQTAKNHLKVLGDKTGYNTRLGLALWALRNGFELPPLAPTATPPKVRLDYE